LPNGLDNDELPSLDNIHLIITPNSNAVCVYSWKDFTSSGAGIHMKTPLKSITIKRGTGIDNTPDLDADETNEALGVLDENELIDDSSEGVDKLLQRAQDEIDKPQSSQDNVPSIPPVRPPGFDGVLMIPSQLGQ
jgi:hypothetical protein